ncbi:MAG: aconitate hydratase, partial [Nitrospirae bacterium]
PWVTAMDVILELLRRLTVKGGVGKIFEYGGPGVMDLSVPERATITNMGAELGATTSVFPSDERTRAFLKAQGRQEHWRPIEPDPDADYAEVIEIDLSSLEPLVAKPHSPDNVVPVRELEGLRVDQVCIGSCTNSSYQVLRAVASVLKGQKVAPHVSMLLNPGSNQVLQMLAKDGSLAEMVRAGVRVLEASCGPCIGMGGAPGTGQVSVRSYNRNFRGRCGNKDAEVYLASPMTCAVAAIKGQFIDPKKSGLDAEIVEEPEDFPIDTALIIPPSEEGANIEVVKGPNISEVPLREPVGDVIEAEVLIVLGDNITTDDIMPAGAKILPLRSNIPAISEYVFHYIDPEFPQRAKQKAGGIIIGGENYGQGSSREHAALAPMYLGVKAVIAQSFARIHRSNLINFGIVPLVFERPEDRGSISQGDVLRIEDVRGSIQGSGVFVVKNLTKGTEFRAIGDFTEREKELLLAGGLLPYARGKAAS